LTQLTIPLDWCTLKWTAHSVAVVRLNLG
jgi:hypothetical protein